jgi:hypothetical protein
VVYRISGSIVFELTRKISTDLCMSLFSFDTANNVLLSNGTECSDPLDPVETNAETHRHAPTLSVPSQATSADAKAQDLDTTGT